VKAPSAVEVVVAAILGTGLLIYCLVLLGQCDERHQQECLDRGGEVKWSSHWETQCSTSNNVTSCNTFEVKDWECLVPLLPSAHAKEF
jgi:hypothetical protein